ncbi:LysR substrate-binding domain-containing protein [Amycolatopsis sp. H20-H5]|nr:LysR substrate-binding domain-containing protein [Amycolatopsis sp. H20-H5]MEC3978366.1 LysR substrate-binding domain-containing protein [Amycolatopsis sp. H20-H5]
MTALAREHPRLEPMVSEVGPAAVADAQRAGELDVALVHEYHFVPFLAEPGLITEPLCSESLYLATASPAPDAAGARLGHWAEAPPCSRWPRRARESRWCRTWARWIRPPECC